MYSLYISSASGTCYLLPSNWIYLLHAVNCEGQNRLKTLTKICELFFELLGSTAHTSHMCLDQVETPQKVVTHVETGGI